MSKTKYVVKILLRREKSQIFHVNLLKPNFKRAEIVNVLTRKRCNFDENRDLEISYPFSDPEVYNFESYESDF